jgi:hypothetical protein
MGMSIHETGEYGHGTLSVKLCGQGCAPGREDRIDDRARKDQVAWLGLFHRTVEEQDISQEHGASLLPTGKVSPLLGSQDFQVDAEAFELQLGNGAVEVLGDGDNPW